MDLSSSSLYSTTQNSVTTSHTSDSKMARQTLANVTPTFYQLCTGTFANPLLSKASLCSHTFLWQGVSHPQRQAQEIVKTEKKKKSTSTYVSTIQGIENGHNYCWMISTLQLLFASPKFRALVHDCQEDTDLKKHLKAFLSAYEQGKELTSSMQKITEALYHSNLVFDFSIDKYNLLEAAYSAEEDKSKADALKDKLENAKMLAQVDPNNALLGFFEALAFTSFAELVTHKVKDKVISQKPQEERILPLEPKKNLEQAVRTYCAPENIEDYSYQDEGIQKRDTATKTTTFIEGFSTLLPLQICRFEMQGGLGRKLHTKMKLPKELLLPTSSGGTETYRLVGFIEHLGNSLTGGHFISKIYHADELYMHNDDDVVKIDDSSLRHAEPYYILYEKV